MRKLASISIAALALAIPSLALAQDDESESDAEASSSTEGSLGGALGGSDDAGSADSSGSRLPVRWAKRPLTLTSMTLAPHFGFSVTNVGPGTIMGMDLGAQFGITDDIQVEATPLSLRFGDVPFGYAIGRIGGTYRILKDDFELGVNANVNFGDGFWAIGAGAPMRLHLGDAARLDLGAHMIVSKVTGGDVRVGLASVGSTAFDFRPGIPVEFSYSIIDQFWAGARTGFGVFDFGNFGDAIFVPLGLDVGATIPYSDGKGPMVDLTAGFAFPGFVSTGAADTINADLWQINIGARGYFFL